MAITSVSNPVWGDEAHTIINCDVTVDALGDELLPFTASPNDNEPSGRKVFEDCLAGEHGPIGEYTPPPPPPPPPAATADQNKQRAINLLTQTDWVNQPDVIDVTIDPHLLNREDFIEYRSALRQIAVNPVDGDLVWPIKPDEQWSD